MSWAHDSVEKGGLGIVDLWNKMGVRGKGIKVGIIDTGITSLRKDFENIKNTDFRKNSADIKNDIDEDGHGTASASILAATGKNLLIGIAPDVDLYIYRFERGTNFDLSDFNTALNEVKKWDLDILSISFSSHSKNEITDKAIEELCKTVTIFCALFHNNILGNPINNEQYQAHYNCIIPVAALTKGLNALLPCEIIDKDDFFQLAFPGEDIKVLDKKGNIKNRNAIQTSIATPFAAGVFALYLSYIKEKKGIINTENLKLLKQCFKDSGLAIQGINAKCLAINNCIKIFDRLKNSLI